MSANQPSNNAYGNIAITNEGQNDSQERMLPSWFAKRYNALIVPFPNEITSEILAEDIVCSKYDKEEVFNALKSAHEFLIGISRELLVNND